MNLLRLMLLLLAALAVAPVAGQTAAPDISYTKQDGGWIGTVDHDVFHLYQVAVKQVRQKLLRSNPQLGLLPDAFLIARERFSTKVPTKYWLAVRYSIDSSRVCLIAPGLKEGLFDFDTLKSWIDDKQIPLLSLARGHWSLGPDAVNSILTPSEVEVTDVTPPAPTALSSPNRESGPKVNSPAALTASYPDRESAVKAILGECKIRPPQDDLGFLNDPATIVFQKLPAESHPGPIRNNDAPDAAAQGDAKASAAKNTAMTGAGASAVNDRPAAPPQDPAEINGVTEPKVANPQVPGSLIDWISLALLSLLPIIAVLVVVVLWRLPAKTAQHVKQESTGPDYQKYVAHYREAVATVAPILLSAVTHYGELVKSITVLANAAHAANFAPNHNAESLASADAGHGTSPTAPVTQLVQSVRALEDLSQTLAKQQLTLTSWADKLRHASEDLEYPKNPQKMKDVDLEKFQAQLDWLLLIERGIFPILKQVRDTLLPFTQCLVKHTAQLQQANEALNEELGTERHTHTICVNEKVDIKNELEQSKTQASRFSDYVRKDLINAGALDLDTLRRAQHDEAALIEPAEKYIKVQGSNVDLGLYSRSMMAIRQHLEVLDRASLPWFAALKLDSLLTALTNKSEASFTEFFSATNRKENLEGQWTGFVCNIYIAVLYLETYWPELDDTQRLLLAQLRQARESAGAVLVASGMTPHRLSLPVTAKWLSEHPEATSGTAQKPSDTLAEEPGFQTKVAELAEHSEVYAEIAVWGYEIAGREGVKTELVRYIPPSSQGSASDLNH